MSGGAAPLRPGDTIGILGGGQLARMLALAAAPLGLRIVILEPAPECPAAQVANEVIAADYADVAALARFADACDVITYEFENVPADTAARLAAMRPVRPGPEALLTTQDRLLEKQFISGLGLSVAPFRAVNGSQEIAAAIAETGAPALLKTRRFGYDGKGQALIREATEAAAAWAAIGRQPAVLEALVPFRSEVSVIAARAVTGEVAHYPLCQNEHRDQMLRRTHVPADVTPATTAAAQRLAGDIAAALNYVGVLAVELFVVGAGADERLIVNEIAPRVHNSGHWTIEGAMTSQFEQHVRAVAGWPLGATDMRANRCDMLNLIGDDVHAALHWLSVPGAHVHLYGKTEARPMRKMGHVTRLD